MTSRLTFKLLAWAKWVVVPAASGGIKQEDQVWGRKMMTLFDSDRRAEKCLCNLVPRDLQLPWG